jgi:methionyl-tRNA formyltransferase
MTAEADAGGILVQEPFVVPGDAYAADVVAVQSTAITQALDRWLPRLMEGWWDPMPQDETRATWNGRRGPADGWIDWSRPAVDILRTVRTASKPHPGAYTYSGGQKLTVWRAELETDWPIRGSVGRVLAEEPDRGLLIQAGDGLIWLTEIEGVNRPRVGSRLGFVVETELANLAGRMAAMEKRLEELTGDRSGRRAA